MTLEIAGLKLNVAFTGEITLNQRNAAHSIYVNLKDRGGGNGSESGGYRAAASALPPAVVSTLDALIACEPLDAQARVAARERGWNR